MRLPASLLARQSPATLAALAKAHARGTLVTHEIRREGNALVIVLTGMRLVSLSNMSSWKVQNRAKQAQSKALRPVLATLARPPLPWDVVIERSAPQLVDAKNLDICAKRTVDDLARWVNVDDATEETVRYTVTQRQGPWVVTVRIGPRRESSAPP